MRVVAYIQKLILLLAHASKCFSLGHSAVCKLLKHCLQICHQKECCFKISESSLVSSCVCYLLLHTGKGSFANQSQSTHPCQLTAVAQQQKDSNKAAQDLRQQAQTAHCSIADLQRQKDQGNSELQSLLSLFTGLGPSGQTAFCRQLATAEVWTGLKLTPTKFLSLTAVHVCVFTHCHAHAGCLYAASG